MSSESGEKKWILNCLKKNLKNKIILRNKQIYTGDEGKNSVRWLQISQKITKKYGKQRNVNKDEKSKIEKNIQVKKRQSSTRSIFK